jgi:hypothetical protein
MMPTQKAQNTCRCADVKGELFQIDLSVGKRHEEKVGDVKAKCTVGQKNDGALFGGGTPILQKEQQKKYAAKEYNEIEKMPKTKNGKG